MEEFLHKDITAKIIQAFYNVYNTLGYGFLEKVYENAIRIEISKSGLHVEQQKILKCIMIPNKLEIIMQIY